MIKLPERIHLANLPTKIHKLQGLSKTLGGPNLYIKRDDHTGMEISGNKVRKLEYSVKEALDNGCNTLITCGAVQSNHCRATAAVSANLGLKVHLVLRGEEPEVPDGNLLLDKLLGAELHFVSREEYQKNSLNILKQIKDEVDQKGDKGYIIPSGASNGIGAFGYYTAMEEIIKQEKELNIHFDCIVVTTGSGGTYAGLYLAKKLLNYDTDLFGFCVCDDKDFFKNEVESIIKESLSYLNTDLPISSDKIYFNDDYIGLGYGISREEELQFIYDFARTEGIVLDPVYTGKALYGLTEEIKKGTFNKYKNVLFIHTGGLFDVFPQKNLFKF